MAPSSWLRATEEEYICLLQLDTLFFPCGHPSPMPSSLHTPGLSTMALWACLKLLSFAPWHRRSPNRTLLCQQHLRESSFWTACKMTTGLLCFHSCTPNTTDIFSHIYILISHRFHLPREHSYSHDASVTYFKRSHRKHKGWYPESPQWRC